MYSLVRCKYEPEIKCVKTITCTDCLEEENKWAEGWIRFFKEKQDMPYSELEKAHVQDQK